MNHQKKQLKIGGVDPSILRELSGAYKPFAKAFKELLSNAYDADSNQVQIRLADDLTEIHITDDGMGMTPFELQSDLTKIGGSNKRFTELTPKGRPKIGSKGIGFLAVARYCSTMEIVSSSLRKRRGKIEHTGNCTIIDLSRHFEAYIPVALLATRLRITSLTLVTGFKKKRLRSSDFELTANCRLRIIKNSSKVQSADMLEIRYTVDCRRLELKAIINYDYLLGLENKEDLSQISDFCSLEVRPLQKDDPRSKRHYTKITLRRLKDFVIRELRVTKRTGRVRNIESHSGIERFVWQLRRCTPIRYESSNQERFSKGNLNSSAIQSIDQVLFSGPGYDQVELTRPVWGIDSGSDFRTTNAIMLPVEIDCEGLKAHGYILGHSETIFPAEYRGVAVRVRNVQIGSPSFFGLEETLSGAAKAILSQITGEINVINGLDAIDALNPGRDGFYEENQHYKILISTIAGREDGQFGLLGRLISEIAGRAQVLSAVQSQIARATQNRNTLLNLSLAINHYGMNGGRALKQFLADESHRANGLSELKDFERFPGPRIAGFQVRTIRDLGQGQVIDFENRTVGFDFKHDRWSDHVFFFGMHYRVVPKVGREADPLCEIDTREKTIYVNWGHPLRQQMGDSAFLKSSVAWKLAYHACGQNIESTMDLALKILTFHGA